LQLGRVVPRKGIDNVIRALARLQKTSTPVRLMVVGGETDEFDPQSNPELARLQSIASAEGVADRVTFTGRKKRDVLKYYYAAADVFVTTPWYEPFGITPLESMACGTPVIGSNVGGIKYSVEDGKTGYTVPPNNPEALAEKIYALLQDNEVYEKMKQNAIRRVNTLFTWGKVAQSMSSLYERILWKTSSQKRETETSLQFIENSFDHAAQSLQRAKEKLSFSVWEAATLLTNAFRKRKRLLVCGNGGSAAESQHLVAELVGRFEISNRQALSAISLTADTSILTAWANDIGYDHVFARQVEAYGQRGDVLFCLSTSGHSENVINAMKTALEKEMSCIVLSGKGGGEMTMYADVSMVVPSNNTQRIQEIHLHIIHTLCSIVENNLFGKKKDQNARYNGNGLARIPESEGLSI
jgi:phosphoheptose isomerase